jgi:kinesin family protein 5
MLSTFLTKEDQALVSKQPVIKDYDSQGNFVFDRKLGSGETSNCKYDTFLAPDSTQEETYNKCAKGIVQDAMDGYNGTILVYGQTGSGKTHTMVGPPRVVSQADADPANGDFDEMPQDAADHNAVVQVEGMRGDDRGLIPRALHDIFQTMKERSDDVVYSVRMSYVQIYCELILDLFDEDDPAAFEGRNANVRENADGEVYLDGAVTMQVNSADECLNLLDMGNQNRVTACTRMNATSSRSHAVLQLQIEGRNIADNNDGRTDGREDKVFRGKLFLVDLAGSERVSKSGVLYQQFTEMKAINLSLCALGNCVAALAQQNGHIPYRDSKLTRLLQNSLGGNSKTSMVITISPSDEDRAESWNAVQFGHRAMKIAVSASKGYEVDYRAVCRTLQNKLDRSEQQVNLAQVQLNQTMSEMESLRSKNARLSSQKEGLESELRTLKATMETLSEGQTGGTMITQPPVSIEELQQRVNEQMEALHKEHEEQLAQLRKQFQKQVATHKGTSNQATEEWHTIEYDLEKEKEGHLDSLRFLR